MKLWQVFRRRGNGSWRQVKPSRWRRKNKSAKYPAAKRVRDRLRARGIGARMRQVALPAWKTHLQGDVLIPAGVSKQTKRNARRLRAKVGRAFKRAGMIGQVNSFVRTYAEQVELFEKYGPGRAARPGTSFHELGLAMDVADPDGNPRDGRHAIEEHLKLEGLHSPLSHEDWHITETDRWG